MYFTYVLISTVVTDVINEHFDTFPNTVHKMLGIESKTDGKDQDAMQSCTTPDPGYHMGKKQKYSKHHQHEPKVSPFPAGDHKAAMIRRESMRNTRHN